MRVLSCVYGGVPWRVGSETSVTLRRPPAMTRAARRGVVLRVAAHAREAAPAVLAGAAGVVEDSVRERHVRRVARHAVRAEVRGGWRVAVGAVGPQDRMRERPARSRLAVTRRARTGRLRVTSRLLVAHRAVG